MAESTIQEIAVRRFMRFSIGMRGVRPLPRILAGAPWNPQPTRWSVIAATYCRPRKTGLAGRDAGVELRTLNAQHVSPLPWDQCAIPTSPSKLLPRSPSESGSRARPSLALGHSRSKRQGPSENHHTSLSVARGCLAGGYRPTGTLLPRLGVFGVGKDWGRVVRADSLPPTCIGTLYLTRLLILAAVLGLIFLWRLLSPDRLADAVREILLSTELVLLRLSEEQTGSQLSTEELRELEKLKGRFQSIQHNASIIHEQHRLRNACRLCHVALGGFCDILSGYSLTIWGLLSRARVVGHEIQVFGEQSLRRRLAVAE
ncbi:hypothetical protein HMN09_01406700 [Mycena chlorophos]|uniref:Uncharacterized protein n=1 Tax=Mycena chlorophos TaxID=658473 RepID=A0A8H6RWS7_MYCCL|nr:hypothetical protein HMN09_01406700 [Mycena chlorophos]